MRELPIHTAMKRRMAFGVVFAATALPYVVLAAMTALRSVVEARTFREALADVGADVLTRALSQAVGCGLVVWAYMTGESPASLRDALGLRRVATTNVLVALLGGLAMHLVLAEIANVIDHVVPYPLEAKLAFARLLTPADVFEGTALVLAVLVVSPVAEELVFRGLVLPRLALYTGAREAIFLTAVLFGLAHAAGGPHAIVPAVIAGLVLAYVQRAQRSVVPAIALHAGSNAVPLLLPASLVRIPGLNVVREGPSHMSPVLVVMAAACLGTALLFLARDDRDAPA